MSSLDVEDDDRDREHRTAFAREFAEHDRWLFSYLMSLLGNATDAQEVFQEVCVTLWRDYKQYQLGTSFPKWASVVGLNQVRRFRRERKRQPAILSDGVIEALAFDAVERVDLMEARRDALEGCLAKLRLRDRELVRNCYSGAHGSFREVAESQGRPVNTVYKAMNRIRRSLRECIDRTVAAQTSL